MADSCLELICVVEGDSELFSVQVSFGSQIFVLRELIREKRKWGALREIDAADLKLRKVRLIRGSSPIMIAEWTLS